jgi:class 3 adenylate cyclase
MTALRVTAIMKTDIAGSTPRFRSLVEADLVGLLAEHREFVSRVAASREGRIFKAGGDGFWVAFPSITAAGLAAIAMQEELQRTQSTKGDDRLAMRIVITLGDVLEEEGDLFGDAVVLADRIEAVTPADEIYLSAAKRLAVNQAEVHTTLVDAFALKGFSDPVPVYRIEHTHRTKVMADQYLLFTDLRGFAKFTMASQLTTIERVLERLLDLVGQVCREFEGTSRFNAGDAYCLSFSDPHRAMAATVRLAEEWDAFDRRENVGCPMIAALHMGALLLFRSYLLGDALNIVAQIVDAAGQVAEPGTAIFVTGQVQRTLAGTSWHERLRRADIGSGEQNRLAEIEIFHLGKA